MPAEGVTVAWRFEAAMNGNEEAQSDLAKYVLESLAEIAVRVRQAETELRRIAGDSSFDAYVSAAQDPLRVQKQVEAIFLTLQKHTPTPDSRVGYAVEPLQSLRGIQALRLAPLLLKEGKGNCLEWTLLLAACLLKVGIFPVIVVLKTSPHAVLGYWRRERDARSVPDALVPVELRRGRIALIESSLIAPDIDGRFADFSKACRNVPDEDILFAVDVRAARLKGLGPWVYDTGVRRNALPRRGEFIGRENELRELSYNLLGRAHLISVNGLPGVGKTVLAAELVHRLVETSLHFDLVVWIKCDVRKLKMEDILDIIMREVFSRPEDDLMVRETLSEPLHAKELAVRRLLSAYRPLLILDGFQDAQDDDVNTFLRELREPGKALLTSQVAPTHLDGCVQMHLRGMSLTEARTLIRHRLKGSQATVGDEIERRIYEATEGLPLAMKIVAGQIAIGLPTNEVLRVLVGARRDPAFWAQILGKTWTHLQRSHRALCLAAALFPFPVSARTLGECSGVPGRRFHSTLEHLLKTFLISQTSPLPECDLTQYTLSHALVRTFVREKLMKDRYYETVRTRARNSLLTLCQESCTDVREGYSRMRQQIGNILDAMESCFHSGDYALLLEYLEYCSYFLYDAGYWRERLEWSQKGYHVATELARTDPNEYHRAGKCAYWEGWYYCRTPDYAKAEEAALRAEDCFGRSGSVRREARVSQLLGSIEFGKSFTHADGGIHLKQAEQHFKQALEGFTADRDAAADPLRRDNKAFWVVTVQTQLGDLALLRGDHHRAQGAPELAEGSYAEALSWYEMVRDQSEQRCGRPGQIRSYDRWASRLARTLGNLGDLYQRRGQPDTAKSYYSQGYELAKIIGLPNTLGACAIGLGLILSMDRRKRNNDTQRKALAYLEEGLAVFGRLGSRAPIGKDDLDTARDLVAAHQASLPGERKPPGRLNRKARAAGLP